jgi:hypothetical protein
MNKIQNKRHDFQYIISELVNKQFTKLNKQFTNNLQKTNKQIK